ncbi:hypothetical protein Xoosp13_164 [Xanthomonas phage Xoo-sp13]|nr:hypothetical protein Xoosp13_164 [Xanthomonas phage Xoo-sp13]
MTYPLSENPTKYQVRVSGKLIGEVPSRLAAEILLGTLTESEKSQASIVPVSDSGNQVLLG